jgi:hypothetical protein
MAPMSHQVRSPMMLRRALTLALSFSCMALQSVGGQRAARPDDVVRAVLQADSVNDWRALLALAHPAAIAEFRESTISGFTFDGSEFPGMPPLSQCMKDEMARSRQRKLDSIYQVPSVQALEKLPADTVFARERRWRAHFPRTSPGDTLMPRSHFTYLGHLMADDSTAYGILVETWTRRPTPDWPVRRAQTITIRKVGAEWRTMLDADLLGGRAFVDMISDCN